MDRKLLPLLSKFCSKNNIQLIILGAAKDDYYKKLEKSILVYMLIALIGVIGIKIHHYVKDMSS